MVINPHSSEVLASTRLCLCDKRKAEYGSCHLFTSHELRSLVLKESVLRSRNIQTEEQNTQNQSEIVHKFLLSGSICAIAASEKSCDTVWFVKIVTTDIASQSIRDDYGHVIQEGSRYIEGRYLEKKHFIIYKEMAKVLYCYQSSIVYPFVNWEASEKEKKYIITNAELNDIVSYVQYSGMQSLGD